MKQHHEEEKVSQDYLYYLVGLGAGLFTGLILDKGFNWILIMGVFGLLFAGFFLNVFVRGRGEKA